MKNYVVWWWWLTATSFGIYLVVEPTPTTIFVLGVGLLLGVFSAALAAVVVKLMDLEEPPEVGVKVVPKAVKEVVVVKKPVQQSVDNDWEEV